MSTLILNDYHFIKSHITRFKKFTNYYGQKKLSNLIDAGISIWTTGSNEPAVIIYSSLGKRDTDFEYLLSEIDPSKYP